VNSSDTADPAETKCSAHLCEELDVPQLDDEEHVAYFQRVRRADAVEERPEPPTG
jgi:hypothetical protein